MESAREYVRRTVMLRFIKMNGAGNDFVMLDNLRGQIRLEREQIARICDRHRGIGADGILLLEAAKNGADFRMRYYNADGGEAEMCGNGARCFARFVEKVVGPREEVSFETPAGVIGAKLHGELVTLSMSDPRDLRMRIAIPEAPEFPVLYFINSGVPHVVIPVENVEDVDVLKHGASIRRHSMFAPQGANVNFMQKRGPNEISIRTYERGVENETLACGTGVTASALIFGLTEEAASPVTVLVRGGSSLQVGFERNGFDFQKVTLTGPAEFVFEGSIEP